MCTCHLFLIGTKNVDKQMKKITEGKVRDRGVTWFPQLVDKSEYAYRPHVNVFCAISYEPGKSIKLHLYWAMKNCEGSPEQLCSLHGTYIHVYICMYLQCVPL